MQLVRTVFPAGHSLSTEFSKNTRLSVFGSRPIRDPRQLPGNTQVQALSGPGQTDHPECLINRNQGIDCPVQAVTMSYILSMTYQ